MGGWWRIVHSKPIILPISVAELVSHAANTPSSLYLTGLQDLRTKRIDVMREHSRIKSFGLDGLYPELIRELAPIIASRVSEIINKLLEIGVLTEDWKCVNISSIFKRGPSHLPANYHLVSLMSVFIKVIESLAKKLLHPP